MNIADIEYRFGVPDINKYYVLFETTGWNNKYRLSKEEILIALTNSSLVVTAYHNEAILGTGRILSDGSSHAIIYDMIVDPLHQGKGIGAKILEILLQYCFERNIRDIQLFCAQGKKEFYNKYGFEIRPENAPGMEFKGNR